MKESKRYVTGVLATGVVVAVVVSVCLFWGRYVCGFFLRQVTWSHPRYVNVTIRPSGLVQSESDIERDGRSFRDPNTQPSRVWAYVNEVVWVHMGLVDYVQGRMLPLRDDTKIYYTYYGRYNCTYFDRQTGLIVWRRTREESQSDGTRQRKRITRITLFAGPDGVSEEPEENLGRFSEPMVSASWSGDNIRTVYDRESRRFFTIDFFERSVVKGPVLGENEKLVPIAAGEIFKNRYALGLNWESPQERTAEDKWEGLMPERPDEPAARCTYSEGDYSGRYVPLLDAGGRIYLIDNSKPKVIAAVGYLPRPPLLFQARQTGAARPEGVLAYEVRPVYEVCRTRAAGAAGGTVDTKYLGMCAATVNREGTAVALAVFDGEGKLIRRACTTGGEYIRGDRREPVPSSTSIYFEHAWGPWLTTAEFLLENLQGPLLNLTAYLCRGFFEAEAGHSSLFVLPNSFAGMLGRGNTGTAAGRLFLLVVLMLPGLLFSAWLAVRVRRNATETGLSSRARYLWTLGTIAFGLSAYITYRLTRRRDVLVTCANCGRLRRPDMEKCHHCGSGWEVGELAAPSWRVAD